METNNSDKPGTGNNAVWVCITVGVLVTLVAMMIALGSAGGGHGHYREAKLLFPYTMLLTTLAGNRIATPLILLAMVQFPIYGAIIGCCWHQRGAAASVGGGILTVHVVAVLLCFSGVLPNFS